MNIAQPEAPDVCGDKTANFSFLDRVSVTFSFLVVRDQNCPRVVCVIDTESGETLSLIRRVELARREHAHQFVRQQLLSDKLRRMRALIKLDSVVSHLKIHQMLLIAMIISEPFQFMHNKLPELV